MRTPIRALMKALWDAVTHFNEDDGWAMASHMALSTLTAVFPFLIFGTALATFLGADRFAETAVHIIFDTWPPNVAKPISDEVRQVLTIPRGGLLTISVLAAAYFASNGVEALRMSLNRAYRVTDMRAWYVTRLISLGYVIVAVVVFAAISIFLVAVPVAAAYIAPRFPWMQSWLETLAGWRIYGTVALVTAGMVGAHLWLPAGKRRLRDVMPGVMLTLVVWSAAAVGFAYYITTFATYTATYAGLASLMIVLVFLYMSGVIFIIGAEINAALMKYRVLRAFAHGFSPPPAPAPPVSETEVAADLRR